jgi:PAS domain S-box-containing protein
VHEATLPGVTREKERWQSSLKTFVIGRIEPSEEVPEMKNKEKKKEELISELADLRQRIGKLEALEADRKRAEEALRESEERYRAVMEQSADGIYLVDVETKSLLEANPAFAQMLAYTTEEIVKLSVYDFVAADRRNIDQRFQNILSMEGSVASERQYRRKDGALLDVWVSVNVISCRGRKVMCTIARDITERKRAGEEREKLIGELTEALDNIKTLRGLIPICASCKKIRDDQGYWQQVEVYVRDRSEAEFSHGLCPDCAKEFLSPINDHKGKEKE